jgi:hypothetical protein
MQFALSYNTPSTTKREQYKDTSSGSSKMFPRAFQSSRSSLQGSGESKKHCSKYGHVKTRAFSNIMCINVQSYVSKLENK